jgi:serine O-acetyltransferase
MAEHHAPFDLQEIVSELSEVRQGWRTQQQRSTEPGGRELPSRDELARIVEGLRGALFPMRLGPPELRQESENFYVGHTLDAVLHALLHQVQLELHYGLRNGKSVVYSTAMCWLLFMVIPPRTVWMRCCLHTQASKP